jgi:CBS domain-containing protein
MNLYGSLTTDTVAHLDPAPVVVASPASTISAAIDQMKENRAGSVVVCEGDRLLGIFTERDVLRLLARGGDLSAPVRSVMSPEPVTVGLTDTIWTAVARMNEGGYRRMPIVDGEGRPAGMVTVRRVVHYLVEHFPAAVYNLPPVAQPTTRDREGA